MLDDTNKTQVMVPKRSRTPAGRILASANNSGHILPKCPPEFEPFMEFLKFCNPDNNSQITAKQRIEHEKSILYYYSSMFPPALKDKWGSSVRMALIASSLCKLIGNQSLDSTRAFSTGIFQDIGRLVIHYGLIDSEPQRLEEIKELYESGTPLHDAEFQVLGTDHCELGAKLLEDWKTPEWLYQSVRHHNTPEFSADAYLAIAHIAGKVNNNLDVEDPISNVDPICLTRLSINDDFLRKYCAALLEFEHLFSYYFQLA